VTEVIDRPTRTDTIRLDRVSMEFSSSAGSVLALQDISVEFPEGGFTALLGPSGCGKSTLLRIVADLLEPTAGQVQLLGESPRAARENRKLGFVFQDAALLPWRSVIENVKLPLQVGGGSQITDHADPHELLEMVGLAGREHALPHELSGGQRQRVSIARALICRPRVLLMDEPFGALDEITRDRMNDQLRGIWKATGTTILFVTHSIPEAVYLSEQVLVLASRPGRVKEMTRVALPGDRDLAMRDTPEFTAIAAHLRRLLEEC
jgi:NitT/TauT family transport system ATP-binding protein